MEVSPFLDAPEADSTALQEPPPVTFATEPEPGTKTGDDAPTLEAVLSKIPASNRELLSELFRGRFVGVRKLDDRDLR